MNHAGDIFEGTFQDIRDFMDSKGYALLGTIKIDDIFLKKELMKKWNLSKMDVTFNKLNLWVAHHTFLRKNNC